MLILTILSSQYWEGRFTLWLHLPWEHVQSITVPITNNGMHIPRLYHVVLFCGWLVSVYSNVSPGIKNRSCATVQGNRDLETKRIILATTQEAYRSQSLHMGAWNTPPVCHVRHCPSYTLMWSWPWRETHSEFSVLRTQSYILDSCQKFGCPDIYYSSDLWSGFEKHSLTQHSFLYLYWVAIRIQNPSDFSPVCVLCTCTLKLAVYSLSIVIGCLYTCHRVSKFEVVTQNDNCMRLPEHGPPELSILGGCWVLRRAGIRGLWGCKVWGYQRKCVVQIGANPRSLFLTLDELLHKFWCFCSVLMLMLLFFVAFRSSGWCSFQF